MAENYKILAQEFAEDVDSASGNNQAKVVYTVPSGTQTSASSISIINNGASANYKLGIVKAEDVNASLETIPGLIFPFVVTGNNTGAAYSTNGITWTMAETVPSGSTYSVAYGDGLYVAGGFFEAFLSNDGINWERSPTDLFGRYMNIVYGSGRFVGIDGYNIGSSTDGITWTESNDLAIQYRGALAFGDGKFVALSWSEGESRSSTDGITWTIGTAPILNFGGLTYGDGKFVAVGTYSDQGAYSTDAVTWTTMTLPSDNFWVSVVYGDGKFVANVGGTMASSDVTAYSTDGITWTQASMPKLKQWKRMAYGSGVFVSVGDHYDGSQDGIAYSTNGIDWTMSPLELVDSAFYAVSAGEQFASVDVQGISSKQILIPTRTVESNSIDEIVGGITLSAGDQIRVYSESDSLAVHIYGVEIS